jgi:hypothetical protein
MKEINLFILALLCLFFQAKGQVPLSQTVRGTVIDKNLKSVLPGATVVLLQSNPVLATSADENGKFKLSNVPIGRQSFLVKMMGYKEFTISNIEVATGKQTVLTFALEEEVRQAQEVVITGEKDKNLANNSLATVSAINMRSSEINRYAGSRSDPSRMASNFAGVAGGGDQRNDIIVRGNSPWGVLWKLEGVDIPNPNHFAFTGNTGGAFSILNNNLLANSDFLTGAFPAEYGNKTAAVFDVKLRKGNNEKREHTAQIGLNGLEFMTEGPISKPGGASYLASARLLSFKALDMMGISIGANGIPQYQDGTFKINLPTKNNGQVSLWGIAGQSSIDLVDTEEDIDDPRVLNRNQKFSSGMYAGGISYEHRFGEKTMGVATVSASGNSVVIDNKEKWIDKAEFKAFDLRNNEGQVIGQYVVTHRFNVRNLLKVGTTYRQLHYKNFVEQFDRDRNENSTDISQTGNSGMFQSFAQWQFRASEKLTVNPGVYFQHFGLNNTHSIEPRISAVLLATGRDRFSFAAGMHSQTAPLFIYQYQFRDKNADVYRQQNRNLGFSKSLQAVLGYQRNIGQNLNFKAEAYYQHLYNVPISRSSDTLASIYSILNFGADYNFIAFDSMVNEGTGKNYGVELSLERSFSKGFYFLTNVSFFRSTFKGADGVDRSSVFDLGHVANVLAGKEFQLDDDRRRSLSFDFKITHSGGRHYLPVDREASIRDGKTRYDLARAYEPKLKDYFRTDFKITYQINRPKANHNLFLAADNVLNTQNILAREWNPKKKEVQNYYQLGLFPYLGYRVQF